MKTLTLIPAIMVLSIQITFSQIQTSQVKVDKINLHVVQQPKKATKNKTLPVLVSEKKQVAVSKKSSTSLNINTLEATTKTTNLSYNDLKIKAEEFFNQAKMVSNNALKLIADNKIMQLEIANQLQQEAYEFQKKSLEISFQNTLAEFNFNKIEFYQLLKSVDQTNDITTTCINKHNGAERDLKFAKEMLQEAYAMPNLASVVGTMSNAEEKEYLALQKQNQAIEQLKTIVLNSISIQENLVCLK